MRIGPPVQTAPRELCSATDPSQDARTRDARRAAFQHRHALPVTGQQGEIHIEPARDAQALRGNPAWSHHDAMAKCLERAPSSRVSPTTNPCLFEEKDKPAGPQK